MNQVNLIGRLARDPETSVTSSGVEVARFSIAINRGKKDGKDLGADFPNIVCFRKTAELAGKYLKKGQQVGITGHIQTGSYEKNGQKVYTTDVIADSITMIDWGDKAENKEEQPTDGFALVEEDIPF